MESSLINTEEKICRICLDSNIENEEEMINPCRCSGNSKYVHRNCLNQWRSISQNPMAYSTCMECNYTYRTEREDDNLSQMILRPCISCYNCNLFISRFNLFFIYMNYLIIYLLTILLAITDQNNNYNIKNLMFRNTTNTVINEEIFTGYLLFTTTIYVLSQTIFFYCSYRVLNIRRSIQFCNPNFVRNIKYIILLLICLSIISYFLLTLSILFLYHNLVIHHAQSVIRYHETENYRILDYDPIYDNI